jgi:alpha-mannosidase
MQNSVLKATSTELAGPYYELKIDGRRGGVTSMMKKNSDQELLLNNQALCTLDYNDGADHVLRDITVSVLAEGPVLARVQITGQNEFVQMTQLVTLYQALDRIDIDISLIKKPNEKQERLCALFPILNTDAQLHIETCGAILRPYPQPQGDLLPGADPNRFAVQNFVDIASPQGMGVTLATPDAFCLRKDLPWLSIECLGDDHNFKEVAKNQNGESEFHCRFSLQAYTTGYHQPRAFAMSHCANFPLVILLNGVNNLNSLTGVIIDPERAVATCLKPTEPQFGEGVILRLWEVAGTSAPITIGLPGYNKVMLCDLLEQDKKELELRNKTVTLDLAGNGFAALRLLK